MAAELREKEIESDLVEGVRLLDDLSGIDVVFDDVDEFLEAVASGPTLCQLEIVRATRLGFNDEVEYGVLRHLRGVPRRRLIEGDHVRRDRHRGNRREGPHLCRCGGRSCIFWGGRGGGGAG